MISKHPHIGFKIIYSNCCDLLQHHQHKYLYHFQIAYPSRIRHWLLCFRWRRSNSSKQIPSTHVEIVARTRGFLNEQAGSSQTQQRYTTNRRTNKTRQEANGSAAEECPVVRCFTGPGVSFSLSLLLLLLHTPLQQLTSRGNFARGSNEHERTSSALPLSQEPDGLSSETVWF